MQRTFEPTAQFTRDRRHRATLSGVTAILGQRDSFPEWGEGTGEHQPSTPIDFLTGVELKSEINCSLSDQAMINAIRQIRSVLTIDNEPSWKVNDPLKRVFSFYINKLDKAIKAVDGNGFIEIDENTGDVGAIYPDWNTTGKGAILSVFDYDESKFPVLNQCYQSLIIHLAEKGFSTWDDVYLYDMEMESIDCIDEDYEGEDYDKGYYESMKNEYADWTKQWEDTVEKAIPLDEIPKLLNSISLPEKMEEVKEWILEGTQILPIFNSFEDFCPYSKKIEYDSEMYLPDVGFHICGSWRGDLMERICEVIDMNANEIGLVPLVEINWLKNGSYDNVGTLPKVIEWLYKHPGI